MKNCPTCNRSFNNSFAFCLEDGTVLSSPYDPEETLLISKINDINPPPQEHSESSALPNDIPSPTEFSGAQNSAFWRKKDGKFNLYVNGIEVTHEKTPNAWRDDDLLVFETQSKLTYLLRNYKNTPDNQLIRAEVLQPQGSAFWKKKDGTFLLYVNGVDVTDADTPCSWIDDDLLIYVKKTNRTYILKDCKNAADNQLLPAEVL